MRLLVLLIVVILTLMDFAPFPVTGLILIWIVLFRPMWFYEMVRTMYRDKLSE